MPPLLRLDERAVVAAASHPTYDPGLFVGGITAAELRRLTDEKAGAALRSRIIAETYPPASTFKVISLPAAVSSGASIKGTYAGSCVLTDLVEHESLVMKLDGAGAPGTIGATVRVRFTPEGDSTRVSYDADAVVGGMIGGVGQRMLTSVSRRMAAEFFGNVDAAIAGGPVAASAAADQGLVTGAGTPPSRKSL